MDFSDIKTRLLKLDTSQLCDVSENVRVLDADIKPLISGLKMVGIAHTVSCPRDYLELLNAISHAQPDEVFVVASNGAKKALFGEIMSSAAQQKGVGGIVCDGACRDGHELKKLNFPIYVKYTYPCAEKKVKWGERQIPVVCGGVEVKPGDIVFGDDDGVIVIDPRLVLKILADAEALKIREQRVIHKLTSGKSLNQVLKNFDKYYQGVQNGEVIQLEWDIH